mgnify:CR=1 FL=1
MNALAVSERSFQTAVVELCQLLDWRVFHPLPATNQRGQWRTFTQGHPGFPDLTLSHRTRGFLMVELKSDTGRLSEAQKLWRDSLQASGVEWHLWRPSDWALIQSRLLGVR